MTCGESFAAPATCRTMSRPGAPGPLSLLQIAPAARAPIHVPLPRVHDEDTVATAGAGGPISLNSHCTAPATTAGALVAAAGQLTALCDAAAATLAPLAASAASRPKQILCRAPTRPR